MKSAIIENIDTDLLKQQKEVVTSLINNINISETEKEALEGVLNLLDNITDEIDKDKIPNGWSSFIETHHEICFAMAILDQDDNSPVMVQAHETEGLGGIYELSESLAHKFEAEHKGYDFDGDYMDKMEEFISKHL